MTTNRITGLKLEVRRGRAARYLVRCLTTSGKSSMLESLSPMTRTLAF